MPPLEAKRVLGEILPLHSTDTEPQPFIFEYESSPIFDSGQPDRAEPAAEIVAAAPLSEAEDARTKQGGSLLADLPPSRSFFERKPSPAIFSGEGDKVGPAEETAAATPPPHAATAQQTKSSPLTDLPALASTDTKSAFPSFEQDLPSSSLSGQPDSLGPPVNPVGAAGATEAESPRPQPISSLLTALRVLTGKPSPPVLQKEASRSTLASQPDNAGMLGGNCCPSDRRGKCVGAADKIAADRNARPGFHRCKIVGPDLRKGALAPAHLRSASRCSADGKSRCSCPSNRYGKCGDTGSTWRSRYWPNWT